MKEEMPQKQIIVFIKEKVTGVKEKSSQTVLFVPNYYVYGIQHTLLVIRVGRAG